MVSTRNKLGDRQPSPELDQDDPKVQAILRKLEIDGTDVLKGQANQLEDKQPVKIYYSKGATYVELGTEPVEWLEKRGRKRRRLSTPSIEDEVEPSKTPSLRQRRRAEAMDDVSQQRRLRSTIDAAISDQTGLPVVPSSTEKASCLQHVASQQKSVEQLKEEQRLEILQRNRKIASENGYTMDAFEQNALRETLTYTIARKLRQVGQLNSKIVKAQKCLRRGGLDKDELLKAIALQREQRDARLQAAVPPSAFQTRDRSEISETTCGNEYTSDTCDTTPPSKSDQTEHEILTSGNSTPASVAHSFVTADQSPNLRKKHLTWKDASDASFRLDLSRLADKDRAECDISFSVHSNEPGGARLRRERAELEFLRSWPTVKMDMD